MKKASVRIIWLIVCMIGILMVSCAFLIYSFKMKQSVLQFEEQANHKATESIQTVMDNTWDSLSENVVSLYFDPIARKLEQDDTLAEFRADGAYSFRRDIQDYIQYNPIIEDIMIYFPTSDMIVGKYGVYHSHTYWLASFEAHPPIEYDAWDKIFRTDKEDGYFPIIDDHYKALCLGFGSKGRDLRYMVAKINPDELEKQLGWVSQSINNRLVAIVDDEGISFGAVGNTDAFIDQQTGKLEIHDASLYLTTKLDSDVEGIYYLIVSEKSLIYQLSSKMVSTAILAVLAVFLFSIIISYSMIRKQLSPLDQIMGTFDRADTENNNEFYYIASQIDSLRSEQERIAELSNRQLIIIEQAFLSELLLSDDSNQKDPETVANLYNVSLEFDHFAVVAVKYDHEFSEESIIRLVLSWGDASEIYWLRKENTDIFLLCFDEGSNALDSFQKQLLEIVPDDAAAACSQIVDTDLEIFDCWVNCAKKLELTEYLAQADHKSKNGLLQDSFLNSFLHCLCEKDYRSIHEMETDLYQNCVFDQNPFLYTVKKNFIVFSILTYCPTITENELRKLADAANIDDWTAALNFVLAKCDSGNYSRTAASEKEIALKAKNIIEQWYYNPSLDVRMVANLTGYSQSYVSSLFKHAYGFGISQYINIYRINKAKELLVNQDENIKDIAIKVGFLGDTQFIRAFKRIENVPPGTYRSTLMKTAHNVKPDPAEKGPG